MLLVTGRAWDERGAPERRRMHMIRVALVGLGGISAAHIQGYLTFPQRCRIVAMADIVPEKARKRAREYGVDCEILDDYHKLLRRGDIDLVDICTPPYLHGEMAVNCLRDGINVLCEKPMAASLEECDQVLAAARESGKLFSSIAQNRFRAPIAAFKALLDSGLAGPVKHFQVDSFWWRGHCYYDMWWRGTWEKEGGGCTLNHAVHHIDMLCWMMGLPQEVVSVLGNVAHDNAEVEDLSVSVLRYPGALATITASVVHHGERQALTAQCQRACIAVPHRVFASQSLPTGFPKEDAGLEEALDALYRAQPPLPYEGHTAQIENVLGCLERGESVPAVTGEDGRRAIELITAIYKAGATRRPVALPLPPEDPFYTVAGIRAHAPHFYEKTASLADLGENAVLPGNYFKG